MTGPTCGPDDLLGHLLGRWLLRRRIEDRLRTERRSVLGEATLTLAADGHVDWSEQGTMTWFGRRAEVSRSLRVVRREAGWWVCFADGRDFHPWAPGSEVVHPCGADHYRGRIDVEPLDGSAVTRWTVSWDVRGPDKDYAMHTEHTRPQTPRVVEWRAPPSVVE